MNEVEKLVTNARKITGSDCYKRTEIKDADELLNQALALLRAKPKAGEFTKEFREVIGRYEVGLKSESDMLDKGKAACALLDAKEQECEKHRWIPVGERLPEVEADCLVIEDKFARLGVYQLNSDTLRMQWQVGGCISKQVTHWMPIILPEQALQ